MSQKLRGKWALGIQPRDLTWIIKDKLAICERPGGFGANHRKVRRQEEVIWLRENDFHCIVNVSGAPHNLQTYEEIGVPYRHVPILAGTDIDQWCRGFFAELNRLLAAGNRTVVHAEDVNDQLVSVMGAYLRWLGVVTEATEAVTLIERLANRALEPSARSLIFRAHELRDN
jgi:hypothetical protein